jgi:hypothetical protein
MRRGYSTKKALQKRDARTFPLEGMCPRIAGAQRRKPGARGNREVVSPPEFLNSYFFYLIITIGFTNLYVPSTIIRTR